MDYITYSKRLNYLLELIEKGNLQSPVQLTEKFDCTERTVRKMINDLRLTGHDIKYSRKIRRYAVEKK